jgi:hypothetical protein
MNNDSHLRYLIYTNTITLCLLQGQRELKIVSPTSRTLELIGFGYPYLPRYMFRRLSKKLGVLNEDGDNVFG